MKRPTGTGTQGRYWVLALMPTGREMLNNWESRITQPVGVGHPIPATSSAMMARMGAMNAPGPGVPLSKVKLMTAPVGCPIYRQQVVSLSPRREVIYTED